MVKFTNSSIQFWGKQADQPSESLILLVFLKLARCLLTLWHLRQQPQARSKQRKIAMIQQSTFASKLAAAASALILSLVLISGTVSMPQAARASIVYVGEIA
ncbi:MAG: hypothetical protein ACK4YM_04020 [Novosphingobium sp.]